jgi:hypothetical protein
VHRAVGDSIAVVLVVVAVLCVGYFGFEDDATLRQERLEERREER